MTKLDLRPVVAVLALIVGISAVSCQDTSETTGPVPEQSSQLLPSGEKEFYPFDEPPVLVIFERPIYPELARQNGLTGSVTVAVTVGPNGAVEAMRVLKSSDAVFDSAALEAAAGCRFKPARLRGEPTRSRVVVPFHFRLDK